MSQKYKNNSLVKELEDFYGLSTRMTKHFPFPIPPFGMGGAYIDAVSYGIDTRKIKLRKGNVENKGKLPKNLIHKIKSYYSRKEIDTTKLRWEDVRSSFKKWKLVHNSIIYQGIKFAGLGMLVVEEGALIWDIQLQNNITPLDYTNYGIGALAGSYLLIKGMNLHSESRNPELSLINTPLGEYLKLHKLAEKIGSKGN